MKWRSILVLACVAFSLFASSFSSPNKASASLTGADLAKVKSSCASTYQGGVGGTAYANDFQDACNALVDSRYQQYKDDPSSTVNSLGVMAFNDYKSLLLYLQNNSNTLTSNVESTIGFVLSNLLKFKDPQAVSFELVSVNQILSGYQNRMLVDGGGLTPEEAEERRLQNAQAAAAENARVAITPAQCGITSGEAIFACLTGFVDWLIRVTFLQLAGFVLWISANLLDYVIKLGIIGFSTWAPENLYQIWQIVRQVISMFVVFSGLYIGFMYIIGQKAQFQRYFVWIAIFGIFVNFSYPLTRAAIDLSNIISISIYNTTVESSVGETVGSKLMTKLGLQGLVAASSDVSTVTDARTSGDILKKNGLLSTILTIGYILYAAYIFFMAAAILMVRTLALYFIVIGSPLLLVDSVIPKLGNFAQKLRGIFFEQLSVSIVFMLMLYISVQMTSIFKGGSAMSATGGDVTQIFNILMMLVVLHIMLKVTKATGGAIGEMATKYVGQVGGFATGAAVGLATGGAGLLARSTIGASAAKWSEAETMKAAKGEASAHDTWTGRQRLALANLASTSSFDLRNTKVGQVAGNMGGLSKGLGFVGRVKSYDQAKEAYDKETEMEAGFLRGARRDQYLADRKDGNRAKMFGTEKAEELGKKLSEQDKEVRRKYAAASTEAKEKMREDKQNASFAHDFDKIDNYIKQKGTKSERDATYSEYAGDKEMQKTLRDQAFSAANKEENKKRDEQFDAIKKFFASSQGAVEVLKETGTEAQKNVIELAEVYKKGSPQEKASMLAEKVNSGELSSSVAKAIISADNEEDRAGKEELIALFNQQTNKEKPVLSKEESDALHTMSADLSEFLKKGGPQAPSLGEGQAISPGGGPKQNPPQAGEAVEATKEKELETV